MTPTETPTALRGVERRTIDAIPADERHGTPLNQFTLWLGANLQITAIVDGALAVVFGADALWAIIGLLVGNLLGGIVMALHSAQGPRLGLPQMISSRAQFGVYGAIVPLVLVIVMYLGFTATGTVLAGQAINELLRIDTAAVGIVLFVAIVAVIAIVGYRWIHAVGRVASALGVAGPRLPRRAAGAPARRGCCVRGQPVRRRDVPPRGLARRGVAADLRPLRRRLLALPPRDDVAAQCLLVDLRREASSARSSR